MRPFLPNTSERKGKTSSASTPTRSIVRLPSTALWGQIELNLRDEHNASTSGLRFPDGTVPHRDGATFVVDNGASTFLPLWHYLLENNALDFLRQQGRRVFVHTVITGGQALMDTLNGFHELAQTTAERNIVVWINEYFGRVEAEGKKFSDMAAYRENCGKVCGAVVFSKRNQDTFGRDLEEMIAAKLTFDEAVGGTKLPVMAKQRLRVVQRDLFDQLDRVPF